MNLRNYKALAGAAALLLVTAVACTDTTVEPKSTISTNTIFSDPSSYQAFLAKLYVGLAVSGQQGQDADAGVDIAGINGGFSQYLRLYWEHEELPTDEATIQWGDVGLPELNTASWNAYNVFPQSMYYRVMFQVSLANEFLRQTTDAVLTSRGVTPALKATIQTYRAEARFLRALSYWHGIDIFGSIPFVTEDSAVGTAPSQATRVAIYNYIVSELTAIQSALPASVPANYGRATTQAANMLLAELYLNAAVYSGSANYAAALTAAQTVIGSGAYTLDANWRRIFSADNNTSPEIIFAIPSDGIHTRTYGGMNFIIHASCGGNMNNSAIGVDGCWWGLRMRPQYYALFDTINDLRASFVFKNGQTLQLTSITGNFNTGYAYPKFLNVKSGGGAAQSTSFPDTDFPLFRLSEAYLIYAEAAVRTTTNLAQALTYVNAIRARAGVAALTAPQLTAQEVLNERGRELGWEAHRRTDLIRYGQFAGPTSNTYIWSFKGPTQAGAALDLHLNLYPIPATELSANPKLVQNSGY
jgi:hypothetical protein